MEQFQVDDTIMVAISIGILAIIFICAFIGLLWICKRQRKRQAAWNRLDNKYIKGIDEIV